MGNKLSFKISSGLKNIIGKDLITDDFIAVFELVKNSFDAYAKNVIIKFNDDKIIIEDDGKGMDLSDIESKWLYVAYSAKSEGVEDDELKEDKFKSYRDKIQAKKFYAGAKGIGRFSCDRLGENLTLLSLKSSTNALIEKIEVNWKDFEKDSKEDFVDIKVDHITIRDRKKWKGTKSKHGTILSISNLNSSWSREKKIKLKHSLEKLINPFEENPLSDFKIRIVDNSELEQDKDEKIIRNKVNGDIKNFLIETLKVKTTQIIIDVDDTGKHIMITLWDRGTLIYKIRKKNNTSPQLKNIKFHLFHLNRMAKANFTRNMGLEPVHFGSIFLYKNGFRIAPYGDIGFDNFGLDTRKTQKHFDRLGSRDLIGRIEIIDNENRFKEISSRDGGLVRNDMYNELVRFFVKDCLPKLENYLKKVQWTNKEDKNRDDLSALQNIVAKSALLNLINKELTDETQLLDANRENLSFNEDEILENATEKDFKVLEQVASELKDSNFKTKILKEQKHQQELIQLKSKLEEEEKARVLAEKEKLKLEVKLKLEKEKNTYLKKSTHGLSDDAKGLIHNIKLTAKAINSNASRLYEKAKNDELKPKEALRRLSAIKFNAEKALKISKLITRANFKTQANSQIIDIVKFIEQYIDLYKDMYDKTQLEFDIHTNDSELIRKANILDLSLVLDDLISNSEKANASKIYLELNNPDDDKLIIHFSDNGDGVKAIFLTEPEEMFELGATSTEDGSGIGLNSVRKTLKSLGGTIIFKENNLHLKGACFEIKI